MIVTMQKVTLLCMGQARDATVEQLAELGVMHLVPVQPPESADVDTIRREISRTQAAGEILGAWADKQPRGSSAETQGGPVSLGTAGLPGETGRRADADATVAEILDLDQQLKTVAEQIQSMRSEEEALTAFGQFDLATLKALREMGVTVDLYRTAARNLPAAPPETTLIPLGHDALGHAFAVAAAAPYEFDLKPLPLPERSLDEVRATLEKARADARDAETRLGKLTRNRQALQARATALRDELALAEARDGMGVDQAVAYLQGFCPADRLDALRQGAREHGWGLLLTDPGEDDRVPTLIRNPAWIRPIRFVFDLIGVTPGYAEADISSAFLFFFSIFFAMVVSDAGYGVLFLALTFAIRFLAPKVPRDVPRLLGLLSVCTIAWGVLTGNYFGAARLPAVMESLRVPWLLEERNLMSLCFLLGAIHLSLAHVWNLVRAFNSTVAVAQLGWIGMTWTMFFVARAMILDYAMPGFVGMLFLASLVAIVFFMTPLRAMRKDWPNHVMLPLTIVNNFGDVVSYVRLFAVGSASTAISMAFNEMAIEKGFGSIPAGIGAALILFSAHALNILLCALGVVVHGVRLNTLEFCGHMGIQWTGFKYRPLALEANAGTKLAADLALSENAS